MVHIASLLYGKTEVAEVEKKCLNAYKKHGVGEVIWLLTGDCNLRCSHCYVGAPRSEELTTAEAMRVVKELVDLDIPVVFLSGGEPLMRKDVFKIMKALNEHGVLTVLSCNGTLLNRDVVAELKKCGTWFVAIPIYGSRQLHDAITGVYGSYELATKAIKTCIDEGLNVCVKTLVFSRSYAYIPVLLRRYAEVGVKAFYLCDLIEVGRAHLLKGNRITSEQWKLLIERLVELVKEYGVEVDIGGLPSAVPYIIKRFNVSNKLISPSCPAGRGLLAISPSGKVLPCNFLLDVELGDVKSAKLVDVIESADALKKLRSPQMFKGPCGRCEFNELCGGCRAKAYVLGDLEGYDPSCLILDENSFSP